MLPAAWATAGLTGVLVRGQGIAAVLPVVGMLRALAALVFVVGTWRFRCE